MANLTLKQLRYFESLARQGHFGRAADICAISQPALSMQIKELEETLGARLFERQARSVRLTPFGEQFAPRARDILRAVDDLGELARASQDGFAGRLRIGVIPTVAPYLLPQIITAVLSAYPDLDIEVRETLTPRLTAELAEGRIDVAIVALPISDSDFVEIPLFAEHFVLVRPAADAAQDVPQSDEMLSQRLLLLEEGHCFRDQALSFCGAQAGRSWKGLEGSSLSTLVQMVGVGMGITLLPEMAVAVETRSAPVSVTPFTGTKPGRTIGMIRRRSTPLAAQLDHLATIVKAVGADKATSTDPHVGT